MRLPRNVLCVASILAVAAAVAGQPQWEGIDDDYRNVRGVNFLAVYPSLQTLVPLNVIGVPSSTAMWHYYDPSGTTATEVAQQLDHAKKAGINSLRVFLSFVMWEYYQNHPEDNTIPGENEFIRRFKHFLGLCADRKLYVMPVLWDSVLHNPNYDAPLGTHNLQNWHASPGLTRLPTLLPNGPDAQKTRDYIEQCIGAFDAWASAEGPFLMWDLWNEPKWQLPSATEGPLQLIQFTLSEIDAKTSAHPNLSTTIVSHVFVSNRPIALHSIYASVEPSLDVIGIHPYGHTRKNIESFLWDASHIVHPTTGATITKPVICTEIGSPGWGMAYQEALNYATNVPRLDLGGGVAGVGFMSWVSQIDFSIKRPFNQESGLFYGNGQVREVAAVMAFVNVAIAQGIPANTLWGSAGNTLTPFSQESPKFTVQAPVSIPRDDYAYLSMILQQSSYAQLSYSDFVEVSALFNFVTTWLQASSEFYSTNNNNPYAATTGFAIAAQDLTQQTVFQNAIPPGSANHLTYFAGLLGIPPATWNPQANAEHLFVANTKLKEWRDVLVFYVINRGGPY